MKINAGIPVFLLLLLSLNACRDDDAALLNQSLWTSANSLQIPYHIRQNTLKQGNLLMNSSFESGRLFYENGKVRSFNLDGWKRIGNHVEWVNTQMKSYAGNEAFEGIHAIKVHRNLAHETEQSGDGIESNFIKVIPGKYELRMMLRLEDILPNKNRLGTKIFDAVSIELHYFDKNKLPVEGKMYNPKTGKYIDNSFKALSLANFWEIEEMPWSEIIGQSCYEQVIEGDVPAETRYIKVFIGLKGTGTLWVDQVDFRYSHRNFSFIERCKPFLDTIRTAELINPAPKKLTMKEQIMLVKEGKSTAPLFNLKFDDVPSDFQLTCRKALEDRVEAWQIENPPFFTPGVNSDSGKVNLHFALLSTAEAQKEGIRKDGYRIQTLKSEIPNVMIRAGDANGLEYGLHTFMQLVNKEKPVLNGADVYDYPDLLNRGLIFEKGESMTGIHANTMRLNRLFVTDKNAKAQTALVLQDELLPFSENTDTVALKVYENRHIESEWEHCLLPLASNVCMVSSESGYYTMDFESCDSYNHSFSDVKIIEKCIEEYPIDWTFVPGWNYLKAVDLSRGHAEIYFSEINALLGVDKNFQFAWYGTAPDFNMVDEVNYFRMHQLMQTNMVFIDNSIHTAEHLFKNEEVRKSHYGKIRMDNPFNAPNTIVPLNEQADFFDQDYWVRSSRDALNTNLQMAVISDYLWNIRNYDPVLSTIRNLVRRYGIEQSKNIVYWVDAYQNLSAHLEQLMFAEVNNKLLKETASDLETCKHYLSLLEASLEHGYFMEKLKFITAEKEELYFQIIDN